MRTGPRPAAFRAPRAVLCLWALLAMWAGSQASAKAATAPPPDSPLQATHLVLTVSGGVSLGAYEGGFLYYLLRATQGGDRPLPIKLAAGTSAGSLNALLALLASCGQVADTPEESLLWQTWIPLGLGTLFERDNVHANGLLSRRWLEEVARGIEQRWERGLPRSCDVVWGVATTRLTPRPVPLARQRLWVPRMEEKFALRIQGQGDYLPPRVTNYLDAEGALGHAMVPTDVEGTVDFRHVRDLVFASASVPVAFPPQLLRYCEGRREDDGAPLSCLTTEALADPFIDGAMFDNTPLRHAAKVAAAGLQDDGHGGLAWRGAPQPGAPHLPDRLGFAFLTHEVTDYLAHPRPGQQPVPTGVVELAERLAATFVSTARSREIYDLLEEMPEIRDRVLLPRRHFPTASGLMGAFFGFFERDFRVFDFALGMYDAGRMLEEEGVAEVGSVLRPENDPPPHAPIPDPWRPLRCLRAVLSDGNADAQACRGDELANFRALLQSGLERMWVSCASLDGDDDNASEACRAARAGAPPPALAEVPQLPQGAWRRRTGESELRHALRLLAGHGFAFHELGLAPHQGHLAEPEVRRRMWEMGAALVRQQPRHDRGIARLALELGVDAVAPAAAAREVSLTLGRQLQLAASMRLGRGFLPSLAPRALAAVALDNLPALLSSDHGLPMLGPVVGLEVEPRAWASRLAHPRLIAAVGFMASPGDRWATGTCAGRLGQRLGTCSRPTVQLHAGIDVLRHLRVQVMASVYPPLRAGESTLWALNPALAAIFW